MRSTSRRTLLRWWGPVLAAAAAPVLAAAAHPMLADSAAGWLALAAAAVLASLAAAAWLARDLSRDVERVHDDIEGAAAERFARYIRQGDWGALGDLAGGFDWLLQEVQGNLRSLERRLLDERARVLALVHTLPDGIVIANLRGEVLHVNAAAARMLGVGDEELRDGKLPGLYELVRQDSLRRSLGRLLERRAREDVVELEVPSPEGRRVRRFTTKSTLFRDPEEQDVGVMLLIRDVTAAKEEESLKEDFFHAVAHDLRAPIFGIQGYARLLEKSGVLGPKEAEHLALIHRSCARLRRLVEDVLDVGRLESGELAPRREPVRLAELAARVRETLLPSAREKGLELVLAPPEREPPAVSADPVLLERALENLAANAVKFTPAGGRAELGWAGAKGGVELWVRDDGPGIPPDKLELVFEKFHQLGEGEARSGFGLGLAIVRRVASAHGGRAWAESDGRKGARFALFLPAS